MFEIPGVGADIEKQKPGVEVINICSRQSPHIYFLIRNVEHLNGTFSVKYSRAYCVYSRCPRVRVK